jgi:hypothetical protein
MACYFLDVVEIISDHMKRKNEDMLRRQKDFQYKNGRFKSKMCDTFCIYETNETMYGRVWNRF